MPENGCVSSPDQKFLWVLTQSLGCFGVLCLIQAFHVHLQFFQQLKFCCASCWAWVDRFFSVFLLYFRLLYFPCVQGLPVQVLSPSPGLHCCGGQRDFQVSLSDCSLTLALNTQTSIQHRCEDIPFHSLNLYLLEKIYHIIYILNIHIFSSQQELSNFSLTYMKLLIPIFVVSIK